jgi:hypothetical protein
MRSDTREIFWQLAQTPEGGVKCVIENHDAWVNADGVDDLLGAVVRMKVSAGSGERAARIEAQRQRLIRLVTPLRRRAANAG